MTFSQQSGPPASRKQLGDLLELLKGAGHADFRGARGPMGFTQRQAGGRFTADEAEAFITQLQDGEYAGEGISVAPTAPAVSLGSEELRGIPDVQLAAELQRRGWVVLEP